MQESTNDIVDKKQVSKKTSTSNKTKKAASKTSTTAEKTTKATTSKAKTATAKKTATSKKTTAKPKASTAKKTSTTTKKTVAKTKSTVSKKTTAKPKVKAATSKKTASKKATTKKAATPNKTAKKVEVLEYYDLPYRYNQTIVKVLAQTPTTLFVYWDISDEDRKKYIKNFGDNFFDKTYPVLIVHNKTLNYSFEIEINDFANSWYFNINDPKCDYEVELGRRAKQAAINLPNNYMHVTSSNKIETPNNHILFEKNQKIVFFKNVKTNTRTSKDISTFNFMQYAGKIYNIYDVYKKIYKQEELQDLEKNPSSKF